jgi:hypothetical protein
VGDQDLKRLRLLIEQQIQSILIVIQRETMGNKGCQAQLSGLVELKGIGPGGGTGSKDSVDREVMEREKVGLDV